MEKYSFNRAYELTISKPFKEVVDEPQKYTDNPLGVSESFINYAFTDNYATLNKKENRTYSELHIEADIGSGNSTSGSAGIQTTIKIFGLSKESRDFVESINNYVVLKAGYKEDTALNNIFVGQVKYGYSKQEGLDIVTYLVCGDGYTPSNTVRISKTWPPKTSYANIIKDLADIWKTNGIAVGELSLNVNPTSNNLVELPFKNPTDTIAERGYISSGFLRKTMDNVTNELGYSWKIINNELFVEPIRNVNRIQVVEVNTSNILSIQNSVQGSKSPSSSSEPKGINVTLFLDGRITSAKKIKIADGDYKGTYTIDSVSHTISYEGDSWFTKLTCRGDS